MRRLAVLLLLGVLVACGGDGGASGPGSAQTESLDRDGDGRVVIGVATNGPRDDGAYYQALVDGVIEVSATYAFEPPIVVDLIDPAAADQELRSIAEQGVDVIVVGASALAESLPALVVEYPDIFWYCNCGSDYPETPGLLISRDRGAELWISGGYAAGLLLADRGGDRAVFLGCCDLPFEEESFAAFAHGLGLVDPGFSATYVATGNYPFDFGNTPGATEAFTAAVAEGADAVAPFLGGAHDPVLRLANAEGLIAIAAGNSSACDSDDPSVDLMVKYDSGDYVEVVFSEILAGTLTEGMTRDFHVGVDPEVGAEFCPGTAEHHIAALSVLNTRIGAGEFADVIAGILSAAYSR